MRNALALLAFTLIAFYFAGWGIYLGITGVWGPTNCVLEGVNNSDITIGYQPQLLCDDYNTVLFFYFQLLSSLWIFEFSVSGFSISFSYFKSALVAFAGLLLVLHIELPKRKKKKKKFTLLPYFK